jgi:hypothetical protein
MTTQPPAPYPSYAPVVTTSRSSSATVALVLAIVVTAVVMIGRTAAAAVSYSDDDLTAQTTVFGLLGILLIVPIALTIVFGHIGVLQTRNGPSRGRLVASVALGAGYLHVLFWANRLVDAVVASIGAGDITLVPQNVFWWG